METYRERVEQTQTLPSAQDPDEVDPLSCDEPWLAALYATSVRGQIADGPGTGRGRAGGSGDSATGSMPRSSPARSAGGVPSSRG